MKTVSPNDDVDWEALDDAPVVGFHMDGSRTPSMLIRTWTNEVTGHARLAAELGADQTVGEYRGRDVSGGLSSIGVRLGRPCRGGRSTPRRPRLGFARRILVRRCPGARNRRPDEANGSRVGSVVLLDTSIPSPKERARPGLVLAAARRVVEITEEHRDPADQVRELGRIVVRAPGVVLTRSRKSLMRRRERRASGGVKEPNMSFRQRAIWISYLRHEPVRLDLSAAILTTQESVERTGNDRCLGWSKMLVGPIRTFPIAGGHFAVLQPGFVSGTAAAVATAIEATTWDDQRDQLATSQESTGSDS